MRILNVHLIVPDFKIDTFSWLKTQWGREIVWFSGPQRCVLPRTILSTTQTVPAVLHYKFRVMLFGFAAVRRVFIKVMAVIGHCLRSRQTHIFMYLDDWLIKIQDHHSFLSKENWFWTCLTAWVCWWIGKFLSSDSRDRLLGSSFQSDRGNSFPSEEKLQCLLEEMTYFQRAAQIQTHKFLRQLV